MREIVLRDPRGSRWRVEVPTRRRERMRGLIGRDGLESDRALLLLNARSIHTFRVRFEVMAALLDEGCRVVGVRTLCPRRLLLPRRGVHHVLELPAGADLRPGDRLTEEA